MMELYILSLLLCAVFCFNVDIDHIVSFSGMKESYFGYSALMFIDDNGEQWVIVGATKANFTNNSNLTSPGNVYKCRLDFTIEQQDECIAMNLRQQDIARDPESPGYEEDNELLGATMAMINDTIIICAPLWKNYSPWKEERIVYPTGRCFNLQMSLINYSSNLFQPNALQEDTGASSSTSQFFYEFAQIGFSVSKRKYGNPTNPVLLGAPGFFENEGGFVQYNDKPLNTESFFDAFTRKAFGKQFHFGDLMGYSITTGYIVSGLKCQNVVVFGAPHFRNERGIVGTVFVVCASKTTLGEQVEIQKQFYGQKSGGGFGTSLVFQDVNNDGLDDLLVGEPLYFDNTADVIDTGTVHIYYGLHDTSVILNKSEQMLNGAQKENGRFGTSMECVGDINKDNYNDIVISAPYENDEKGAIYIYNGGEISLTLSQRIAPNDIGMALHSFGWYTSAAYDIDNNQYPDFIVGSYMSDTVSVFRTRPIVILDSSLEVIPKVIPYNPATLQCSEEFYRFNISLQLCFMYSGKFVPGKIRLLYNMSGDIEQTRVSQNKTDWVKFNDDTVVIQDIIDITKKNRSCITKSAIVQASGREFYESLDESIVSKTSFELVDITVEGEVQPVLEHDLQTVIQTSATFSTDFHDVCQPNLHITTNLLEDEVFLGEASELILVVNISNKGYTTYGTNITFDYSNNTQYLGYYQPRDMISEYLIFCNMMLDGGNETRVKCNFEDTFGNAKKAIVIMRFAVKKSLLIKENDILKDFDNEIVISSTVQSIRSDSDMADNMDTVYTKVKLKTSVELDGISNPDQPVLSGSDNDNIVFTHSYNIFNHGPSPLSDYKVYVCIPRMNEDQNKLISKDDDIQIITSNGKLRWKIVEKSSGYLNATMTDDNNITRVAVKTVISFQEEKETRDISRTNVISCEGQTADRVAFIEVTVNDLEKNTGVKFEIPFNFTKSVLDLKQVNGINFQSDALTYLRNDERYVTTTFKAIYDDEGEKFISTKTVYLPRKYNLGVIIVSPLISVVLLILSTFGLWKDGFFERKKHDTVLRWKIWKKNYQELTNEHSHSSEHLPTVTNGSTKHADIQLSERESLEPVYTTPNETIENTHTAQAQRDSYNDAFTSPNVLMQHEYEGHVQRYSYEHPYTTTNRPPDQEYEKHGHPDPNEHVYLTTNEYNEHVYEKQVQRNTNEHVYSTTKESPEHEYEKQVQRDPYEHVYTTTKESPEHEYEKQVQWDPNEHVYTTTNESPEHKYEKQVPRDPNEHVYITANVSPQQENARQEKRNPYEHDNTTTNTPTSHEYMTVIE